MVMGHGKVNPEFRCENNIIPKSDALQMFGVTINDMLKFDRLQFSCFRIIRKNTLRVIYCTASGVAVFKPLSPGLTGV